MLARGSLARGSSQWLQTCAAASRTSRTFASPASDPFKYTTSDAGGVKLVSKDAGSPTSSLAVVIKAGSRYESAPGVSHALEHFAFKNTEKRSALWVTREVEMLGGSLETSLSRENIVYKARFLREDLPYFVELLSDVLTKTKFSDYELVERVYPTLDAEIKKAYSDPTYIALEGAHSVAYHHGLGLDKLAVVRRYLTPSGIHEYAKKAFTKSNIAVVGSGVPHEELSKYGSEFFADVPSGSALSGSPSKYHGGESRNWTPSGNAIVIAFPGSAGGPKFKPAFTVMSYLLGGEPTIKWSPGNSLLNKALEKYPGVKAVAKNISYSDTGLLYVALSGSADGLKAAAPAVVDAIKKLGTSKAEDIKRAIQNAKFDILTAAEENALSMEAVGQSVIAHGSVAQIQDTLKALEGVTVDTIKSAAKTLLEGKASVGVAGDLHLLPYADEMGLNV